MTQRVLIFGTFDGFHEGHQFVISEAAKKGSELIVAVARDEHVRRLKQKEPKNKENDRLNRIASDPSVYRAVLSDQELGTYHILDELKPDLIALGYDQLELKADLERWMFENHRNIPIEMIHHLEKR